MLTELHIDETWFDIDDVLSNTTPRFFMVEDGTITSVPYSVSHVIKSV